MHSFGFQEFLPVSELTEHWCKQGFYKAAVAPGIYVSKNGEVWNDNKLKLLWVHIGRKGYPTVRITAKNTYLHRILAETFISKPSLEVKLHVNHRNGNKKDFSLSNLEWVTPSGNCTHAYETGLREENKPVKLRDVVTGEVREFVSIGSCARALGKGPSGVFTYLNKVNNRPYLGRYDLVWKNRPWLGFTAIDFGKRSVTAPRPVSARNVETNVVTIFQSARDAADALNIKRSEISSRASGKRPPLVKGYIFTWVDQLSKAN